MFKEIAARYREAFSDGKFIRSLFFSFLFLVGALVVN